MGRPHPLHEITDQKRGQTGVGAVYAVVFMLLIISGVLSFGYVYVTTPAISATDATPEASTIGDELVTDELAVDTTTERSASGAQLDAQAVENFFIDGNTAQIDNHRLIENNDDLRWNVTLIDRDNGGTNAVFDGERRISAGEETQFGGVSTYRTPAILDGDVVVVEVNVWQD